jgi:predicted nucleic acid-binding protein
LRTLVDSNVLLDIVTRDPAWVTWSERALREAAEHSTLTINPIIFAEVSMKFERIEDADAALADFAREPLPYEAGFLAGKAFLSYRRRGGTKRSPMPDFYVGAHAVVGRMGLLTRDAARYETYFPTLKLVAPTRSR